MKLTKQVQHFFKKVKLIDVLFAVALAMILYLFLSNRNVSEPFVNYTPKDENDINLVLFYAEWCPHCQRFEPTWNELANDLDGTNVEGKTVHLKKIDCAKQGNKNKCEANNVNSYPTIKCFTVNGEEEYEGERTYDALETFLHNVIKHL